MAEQRRNGDVLPRWAFAPARVDRGNVLAGGRKLVSLCSWDLFGVSHELAASRVLGKIFRIAASESRLPAIVGGLSEEHRRTCERFSNFFGLQWALPFSCRPSCYTTLLEGLGGQGLTVFIEKGEQLLGLDSRLAQRVKVHQFEPGDIVALQELLASATLVGVPSLLILESITGSRHNLNLFRETIAAARRAGVIIAVDESRALGLAGLRGGGVTELLGRAERPDFVICSFEFALGGVGSVLVGGEVELQKFEYLGVVGANGEPVLPAACVAWARAALDVVELRPTLRERLRGEALQVQEVAKRVGLVATGAERAPLVDIVAPEGKTPFEFLDFFIKKGYLPQPTAVGVRVLVSRWSGGESLQEMLNMFGEIKRFTFS